MNEKQKIPMIIGAIVLGGIFLIILFTRGGKQTTPDNEVIQKTENEVVETQIEAAVVTEDFPEREQAEKYINEGLGRKEGSSDWEHVVYTVIKDPNSDTTVYFTTEGKRPDTESKTGFQGIYKFNTKTFAWTRLLKNVSAPKIQELHTIGLDQDTLILVHDPSADPELDKGCDALKNIGPSENWEFYGISLKNPGKGLSPFEPTEAIRSQITGLCK